MNKKGFTLTELLAVVAIIGILSLIAIPNIIGTVDNIKKDNMVSDAKKLISLTQMEVNSSYDIKNFMDTTKCNLTGTTKICKFYFNEINKNKDIKNDPDDGSYSNESYVEYQRDASGNISYCIYLLGSKRKIEGETTGSCVKENNLYSKDVVKGRN